MMFEYRKWLDFYHVSEKHSYNPDTKTYKHTEIGTVRRLDYGTWIGKTKTGEKVTGKTRKEAAEKMALQLDKSKGENKMIFLVGFDFDAMAAHAAKVGGYFEKGIYSDRVLGIEADSKDAAIKGFLEKRKNWIRPEEKKYVQVLDACEVEAWENDFYRNEYSWMRKLGL